MVNVLWGILIMFVLWLVYWCFTHFDAIKKYMAGNNLGYANVAPAVGTD